MGPALLSGARLTDDFSLPLHPLAHIDARGVRSRKPTLVAARHGAPFVVRLSSRDLPHIECSSDASIVCWLL